ncbi:sensor histidine kinase [Dyadobacter sp. CY323]|uniref:sensor histidine kinase n=1 Tax=Dyadobacter sp. CY323 TaxID=2907302 RepID=UPI001F3DBE4D|nr:histidine kinase [Dyadobacter sp. CY323]MCE6992050.1 histidine kinase [Dyadobacter sp. CY323]
MALLTSRIKAQKSLKVKPGPHLLNNPVLRQLLFWISAVLLLLLIYGTAFQDYRLGITTVLLLLPVHICYYYFLCGPVLTRLFLPGKYLQTVFSVLGCLFLAAVLYRLDEIFIADPYVYQYYKCRDSGFTWSKLDGTWVEQLLRPVDFVNAVERSNVVVWIGVALKFVVLWYERREAAFQAELNFLRSQLHPHFLFNSLNNLYAFALAGSAKTTEIILQISNVLRYMLYECSAEKVLLKRDVEILHDYIMLEKVRYESRLDLNWSVTGDIHMQRITPLLMFPLVENAFKHGASETVEMPWINIELRVQAQNLIFRISNSKPDVQDLAQHADDSVRIGLENIQKRLDLIYAGMYRFEWFNEPDMFIAELEVSLDPQKSSL